MQNASSSDLYWISGSPPSWRVMLALTLKDIPYRSCRLDAARQENRTPAYLRLNPTGQVPTFVHGTVTVRESIAILAYFEREWPERPIFGSTPVEAAAIWQAVMVFENRLAPAASKVARSLFRATSRVSDDFDGAVDQFLSSLDEIDAGLAGPGFLAGDTPTAADLWLFPLLGWIARGIDTTADAVPPALARWADDRLGLAAWHDRFARLPGVDATTPPHWRITPQKTP